MAAKVLVKRLAKRVLNKAECEIEKLGARMSGGGISDRELIKAIDSSRFELQSLEEIVSHFRGREEPRFFLELDEKEAIIEILERHDPGYIQKTIRRADKLCDHVFDLLGSGEAKVGRSPQSERSVVAYEPIDWHADFKSGERWESGTYYREVRAARKKAGSDIKAPWELSRFQHLSTLGQAYWFTGNEKYGREFADQISDWIDNNRARFGVNWACTMEVAIRAVNWVIGYQLFKRSSAVTDEFSLRFLKSILAHGRHIARNLEWSEQATSNHYLSDIVGLVFLGIMFPEFKEAGEWRGFGIQELIKEMGKQVYPDGIDFEASTSYHRLALELFFSAAWLCSLNDIELPQEFWGKLKRMFEFSLYYLKPNGRAPQIGDNDNGRLHAFKTAEALDHAYLLPVAAILFGDQAFKAEYPGFDEEALWLFGAKGYKKWQDLPCRDQPITSKAFFEGGLYIMRDHGDYMIISCGPNGQNGNGGHAHNDRLSFELCLSGEDIIVDPGTYVYTAYPEWRDRFRSTAYHNTVSVDGEEQNRFAHLFSMHDDAKCRCLDWGSNGDCDLFVGEHYGYTRLKFPVVHRRRIRFDKRAKLWSIEDSFTGAGEHVFEWNFHLAEGVEVGQSNGGFLLQTNRAKLALSFVPASVELRIEDGWYSKGYGSKERTKCLKGTIKANIPFECQVLLQSL